MHQYISDFADYIGEVVTIKGWIANIRKSKTNLFFSFRDGSGFVQCVVSLDALGEEAFERAKTLTLESAVAFTGKIASDERQEGGYEVQVSSLEIYHVAEGFPLAQREKDLGLKYLEDNRHLWLRKKRQWAIMRVRNQLIVGIHEFFQNSGFIQMDAPLLTGSACEGTTDLFKTEFFDQPAFLSQSGQLYAEAMAMAQGRVYTFGPTFRAEKSDTPRHLAEFWMIEPEMAFYTNEDNMNLIERFVKHVIARVLDHCKTEFKVLKRDLHQLQVVRHTTFPRVTYTEAVEILTGRQEVNGRNAIAIQEHDLAEAKKRIAACKREIAEREKAIKMGLKKGARKFNEAKIIALRSEMEAMEQKVRNIPQWIESARSFQLGRDFGGSDETLLTRVFDAPVMVYNWPAQIKSFYMKQVDGNPELVKGVDLLAPEGFGEVIGGSERETNLELLIRKIKEHNLNQEELEWYLDLRRYGSVPHSGFGLGLERLVRWVCNLKHVRETIPLARRYGRIMP